MTDSSALWMVSLEALPNGDGFWRILLRMEVAADDLILIAKSLGFHRVGVVDLDERDSLSAEMVHYRAWLAKGHAGEMDYLHRHADLRANPRGLLAGDSPHLRAIVVTMNYLPSTQSDWRDRHAKAVADPARAVVSVYAHGRDYHKVMRQRLVKLAEALNQWAGGAYEFRACVDSAPVLEVALASRCGLGWRGKHTLLLNRTQGSMMFLGVLLTSMPVPAIQFEDAMEESDEGHCGSCTQCLEACPTQAFVGPYELDARRCIAYLTIELAGSIPEPLRPLIGNRIYGCDDCQQVCPWNQFAKVGTVADFDVRHGLDHATLADLFAWTETEFQERHQGSAILRIGYERWQRNLAVGIGNALASNALLPSMREALRQALILRRPSASPMVAQHIDWALAQSQMS